MLVTKFAKLMQELLNLKGEKAFRNTLISWLRTEYSQSEVAQLIKQITSFDFDSIDPDTQDFILTKTSELLKDKISMLENTQPEHSIEYNQLVNENKKILEERKKLVDTLTQFESENQQLKIKILELEKLNTLMNFVSNLEFITTPDEDLNQLFLKYKLTGITSYNDAFIFNDMLVKSYYKIK